MGEPPVSAPAAHDQNQTPPVSDDDGDDLPPFRSILRRSFREFVVEFKVALLSRKYWIFIGTTTVASFHLWKKTLPEAEYTQLIIWLFVLFFAGNLAQKVVDKSKSTRSMAVKLKSSKFLSTAIMLVFFNFALYSTVLSAAAYTTLTIWIVGMFFGVDVASIYAFRNQVGNGDVLGKIFDTQQSKHKKRGERSEAQPQGQQTPEPPQS